MDITNFNFKNILCNNIQIGNGNIMYNTSRIEFIQDNNEEKKPTECLGCGFINPIENKQCEYCMRYL